MNYKNKKNVQIENKGNHLKWFVVIFAFFIILLISRLFILQFVDSASLKEKAYKQSTANKVISPKRNNLRFYWKGSCRKYRCGYNQCQSFPYCSKKQARRNKCFKRESCHCFGSNIRIGL